MFTRSIDDAKRKLWSWWTWMVAWGPELLLALLALMVIRSGFAETLPGDRLLDFGSFVASGQAARDGLNPYGIYPPLTWHVVVPGFETWNQNLNPPISVLLFQLFSLAEPHTMFRLWYVITGVLYSAVIVLLVRRYDREVPPLVFTLWAFALAGFWDALALGQVYEPLVLATVVAWLLLEKNRTNWAGVLIGLVVAVKPNFAVWPALLLLSGYVRPAIIGGVTAAVVSAIPALVFGVQVYQQWFSLLASDSGRAAFLTNASLNGLATRTGLHVFGSALAAGLVCASALWAWRQQRDVTDLSAIALLVALLAAPVAWVHYTLFLLPVICANWRAPGMKLVALLLIVPVTFIGHQFGQGLDAQLTLGSIYNWALILLLFVLVADQLRKAGFLQPRHEAGVMAPISAPDPLAGQAGRNWGATWAPRGPNLVLAIVALAVISAEFPRTLPGPGLLDFGSFVASGQAAREGLNPYGIYPLTFRVGQGVNPNLNPPISALLFQLFSLTEVHRMFRIWYCVSVALFATAIILLVRRYKETPLVTFALVACALAGVWETLVLGQIYIPLVLAAVGAWLLLERGSMAAAGILMGIIVAVKPNFAVWPALLFLSGRFQPALISVGTALIISAIPAIVIGPEVYRQWFEMLAADNGRAFFLTNASISGLAARADISMIGTAASLFLLGGAALWALFRRPSLPVTSTMALLLSVLASPIGWVNYTLFLLPVFCWKWSSPIIRIVMAFLVIPTPFVLRELSNPGFRTLTRGSLYNWALLLLLVALVAEELRNSGFFSRTNPLPAGNPARSSTPSAT